MVSSSKQVLLAQLGTPNSKGELKPGAHLVSMYRDEFEDAIDEGLILDTGELITLPPWLDAVSKNNLSLCDGLLQP